MNSAASVAPPRAGSGVAEAATVCVPLPHSGKRATATGLLIVAATPRCKTRKGHSSLLPVERSTGLGSSLTARGTPAAGPLCQCEWFVSNTESRRQSTRKPVLCGLSCSRPSAALLARNPTSSELGGRQHCFHMSGIIGALGLLNPEESAVPLGRASI
jgi:hypothetical protein